MSDREEKGIPASSDALWDKQQAGRSTSSYYGTLDNRSYDEEDAAFVPKDTFTVIGFSVPRRRLMGMLVAVLVVIAVAVAIVLSTVALSGEDDDDTEYFTPAASAKGIHGAVATENAICSGIVSANFSVSWLALQTVCLSCCAILILTLSLSFSLPLSLDLPLQDIGLKMMKDYNGNAVDSAIASCLCIGVLNSFSSGIGGGGVMV